VVLPRRQQQHIARFHAPLAISKLARSRSSDAGNQDVLQGALHPLNIVASSSGKVTDVRNAQVARQRLSRRLRHDRRRNDHEALARKSFGPTHLR
jgi:hypothetical protein